MMAFTGAYLDSFSEADLDQFEAVLDIPDPEIYAWIAGRTPCPPERRSRVLDLLLTFRYAPGARSGPDPTL